MASLNRRGKILAGLGLAAIGAAAGGYALQKAGPTANQQITAVTVTLTPAVQNPYPAGWSQAVLRWTNPTATTVAYGIQGDIIVGGVVAGHWWTSRAVDTAALNAYQSGGNAALQPFELKPQNRVAVVSVAAGQQGSATLVTHLGRSIQVGGPETWSFVVQPNYRSGMVISDPIGTSASRVSGSSRWVLAVPRVA